jgi:2-polyprenyl-3-methyl-5-hydroxy-6-metoxy-1,4-benzoquinol methylase
MEKSTSALRWKIAQSAEKKWWKNYLKNKNVDEYLAWKKNYWQTILDACQPFVHIQPTDTLLDAGCGPAGIFIYFDNNKVTAFDPLLDSYEADLPHFKQAFYPNTTFVNTGIEKFTSLAKYDFIFCLNAINHVQDIELGYDVLCKYLNPNGKLIISIDAHNHNFFKHVFKALPGDILHPHQYDLEEYETFLTKRGLRLLSSRLLKHEFFFDHYLMVAEMV